MKTAIKYTTSTGKIIGMVSASNDELLDLQVSLLHDGIDAIEVVSDHGAIYEPDKWRVVGQDLEAKTELTISTDKATIDADGVDESTISITPATAIDLIINGNPIALGAGEGLVITSDAPKSFVIYIDSIDYYANRLLVRAS